MASIPRFESYLTCSNQRLREHARRFRRAYATIAAVLFVFGLVASAQALELDWRHLKIRWLLINVLAGAPVAIALNAVGLKISAGIVGASLSFLAAFRTCCIAICSNLLPIPAGTLIHASSLASRGGSAVESGIIVLIGNMVSLAVVMALAGAVLTLVQVAGGLLVLIGGVTGSITGAAFVLKKSTLRVTFGFLTIRVLRALMMVFRIQLSFLVIGMAISTLDAALFSGAVILGTTVVVFPAGLGVSEALAALLALATAIAPGAAFLATALNRLSTLAFAGLVALVIPLTELDDRTNG